MASSEFKSVSARLAPEYQDIFRACVGDGLCSSHATALEVIVELLEDSVEEFHDSAADNIAKKVPAAEVLNRMNAVRFLSFVPLRVADEGANTRFSVSVTPALYDAYHQVMDECLAINSRLRKGHVTERGILLLADEMGVDYECEY